MAVIRIAVERLCTYEPSASTGCRYTDFTTKLVTLTLADTLYSRLMDTVDLVFIFSALMKNSGTDFKK